MLGTFNIFFGQNLSSYLKDIEYEIRNEIDSEEEDYILNVNETEYVNHLVESYKIESPAILFDDVFVATYEKKIPGNYGHESYNKIIFVYHIPFEGNGELLRYRPNQTFTSSTSVYLENNEICFEIVDYVNSTHIKNQAESTIKRIINQAEVSQKQIEKFNDSLPRGIKQIFEGRKESFLNKNKILESLNVPIKKTKNLPETYSIPTPEVRKSVNVKPIVTEKGYTPEPTLDYSTYMDILQTIFDFGKSFERLPSTYKDKTEEELRDHIILQLEPRFEGSTTGETFNKTGKTDILIRHERTNVFIAECKFWKGKQSYLDSITQLFKYLTWRDSKVAVIIFVSNKKFSSVLETVKEVTPEHPNYLGFVEEKTESWFNYRFHLNDDENREVKLAVLLFHIPKKDG